jgi:hypothetical protein
MGSHRKANFEDRVLCARIVAEYLGAPQLALTIDDGCRRWNIGPSRCARLLGALLASRFLRRTGDTYVRADPMTLSRLISERNLPVFQ